MKPDAHYTHESGCGRCVFFAVDHCGGIGGWSKVILRFLWHRVSGDCRRTKARYQLKRTASSPSPGEPT